MRMSISCPFAGSCSHRFSFFSHQPYLCRGYLYVAHLVFILSVQKISHMQLGEGIKKSSLWERAGDVTQIMCMMCKRQREDWDLDCCSLNVKQKRDTKGALLRLCTCLRVKSKAFNTRHTTFMILRLLNVPLCSHLSPETLDYLEVAFFSSVTTYCAW